MNFQETGSGIGLMITRRIVKQHHGDISFSSTEGKGTIFTVTFPLKIKLGIVVERKKIRRKYPLLIPSRNKKMPVRMCCFWLRMIKI